MKSFSFLIFVFVSLVFETKAMEFERINAKISEKNYNGAFGISWDSPSVDSLKSWRVEFTLSGSYIGDCGLFWTYHHPSPAILEQGITVSVTSMLQFQIKQGSNVVSTEDSWLVSGKSCTLTFQFILYEDNEGVAQKGEFSIVSGNQRIFYTIEDAELLLSPVFELHNTSSSSMLSRFQTYNGDFKYSDVSLYRLSNQTIPEPSTSILLLTAGILLSLYRRR